jgi:hypothetical protein
MNNFFIKANRVKGGIPLAVSVQKKIIAGDEA